MRQQRNYLVVVVVGRKLNDNEKLRTSMRAASQQLSNRLLESRQNDHDLLQGLDWQHSVGDALRSWLPSQYGVAWGQLIDVAGTTTGENDLIIYLTNATVGLLASLRGDADHRKPQLVPCEASLAVVEVKTVLKPDHHREAVRTGLQVRELRPYDGDRFVGVKSHGQAMLSTEHHIMRVLFAADSDLAPATWLEGEWRRHVSALREAGVHRADVVDRIVVLGRGILNPINRKGLDARQNPENAIYQWCLHLLQHLERESKRRPPVDWLAYSGTGDDKWQTLVVDPADHHMFKRPTPSPRTPSAPAPERVSGRTTAGTAKKKRPSRSRPSPTQSTAKTEPTDGKPRDGRTTGDGSRRGRRPPEQSAKAGNRSAGSRDKGPKERSPVATRPLAGPLSPRDGGSPPPSRPNRASSPTMLRVVSLDSEDTLRSKQRGAGARKKRAARS